MNRPDGDARDEQIRAARIRAVLLAAMLVAALGCDSAAPAGSAAPVLGMD